MKVEVTQEHINNGTPSSTDCCPIALALRTTTPDQWRVGIYSVFRLMPYERYALPCEASSFIKDFDYRGLSAVNPFTFEMELKDAN